MEYKYDITFWVHGETKHEKLVLSTPITDYDLRNFSAEHDHCVVMNTKLINVGGIK